MTTRHNRRPRPRPQRKPKDNPLPAGDFTGSSETSVADPVDPTVQSETAAPSPQPDVAAEAPVEVGPVETVPVEPLEGEAAAAPAVPEKPALPAGSMTFEQFDAGLCGFYSMVGTMPAVVTRGRIAPLLSLQNASKMELRPPAHRALYDSIVETPWLHFLLDPASTWAGRVMVICGFYGTLGYAVALEIGERRKARADSDRPPRAEAEAA